MANDCVFCKIASQQIAVMPVYENDEFLVFPDQNPQAPFHVLLIPRAHYPTIMDVTDPGVLGRALSVAQETARALAIAETGFRIVLNCGDDGGQTVRHVHWHILGGRSMSWPPG